MYIAVIVTMTVIRRIFRSIGKHGIGVVAQYGWDTLIIYVRMIYGQLRLSIRVALHKRGIATGLLRKEKWRGLGDYRVLAIGNIGYATRSISSKIDHVHGVQLITADVGDDTVSIINFSGARFGPRRRIHFPRKSAPMMVSCIHGPKSDATQLVMVGTFNFDATHEYVSESTLYRLDPNIFNSELTNMKIDDVGEKLLSRRGHHGYRGLASCKIAHNKLLLVVTDRDADQVWIAETGSDLDTICNTDFYPVRLSQHASTKIQPIGVALLPSVVEGEYPKILIGQRQCAAISVLSRGRDSKYAVERTIEIDGLSRSSIAVAQARGEGKYDVLIALWGGDPCDLDSPHKGAVAVVEVDEKGFFRPVRYFPAGIHPTDVVSGDFDGDGLDEIAVLNYGAGLSLKSRTDLGDVRIFKNIEGEYKEIAILKLPSPRVGHALRTEKGEPDLLFISLFFERKIAAVKFVGARYMKNKNVKSVAGNSGNER